MKTSRQLVADPTIPPCRARCQRLSEGDQRAARILRHLCDDCPTARRSPPATIDRPTSFVGENFTYRPYFQDATKGQRGRFFALGTTSLKRGYYFSSPVMSTARSVASSSSRSISMPSKPPGRRRRRDLRLRPRRHHLHDRPAGMALFQPPAADAERLARTEASRRYAEAEADANCRSRAAASKTATS